MSGIIFILGILPILVVGFIQVRKQHISIIEKIGFANEYRNKYIEFVNKYNKQNKSFNHFNSSGKVDEVLYNWLTLKAYNIQITIGSFGIVSYQPPFGGNIIRDYEIIVNVIPKFRNSQIDILEITTLDDCLVRYIGFTDSDRIDTASKLKNPFIWFREGFKSLLSIPILILNWFGILNNNNVNNIKSSVLYTVISGIIGLTTLISGLVTIIVGFDATAEFLSKLFN